MITFGRWQDGERFYIEVIFGPSETVDTTIVVSYKDEDGTALHAALNVTQVTGDSVIGWIPVPAEVDSLTVGSGADGASYDISDFNEFSPALDYTLDDYNYNAFDDLMSNDGLAGLDGMDGLDAGVEDQVMDSGIESGIDPFAAQWLEPLTTQYGDVDGWDKNNPSSQQYSAKTDLTYFMTGVAIDRDESFGYTIVNQLSSTYKVDNVGHVLTDSEKSAMLDKPDLSAAFMVFLSEDKKNQLVYLTDGVSAVFEEYPVSSTITVSSIYKNGDEFYGGGQRIESYPLTYKDLLVGSYKVPLNINNSDSGVVTGHGLPKKDLTYNSSIITDSVIDAPKNSLTSLSTLVTGKSVVSGITRSDAGTINIGSMVAYHNGAKRMGTFSLAGGKPIVFLWSNNNVNVDSILSQLDELSTPLPNPVSCTILNENFTAPNGVFSAPSAVDNFPTFHGSTFKVAPRVFDTLDGQLTFPGVRDVGRGWNPFRDCPNITRIENQGTLGAQCVIVSSASLAYVETDGVFSDDGAISFAAYPTFSDDCHPVVVDGWIAGPIAGTDDINNTLVLNSVDGLPPFPADKVVYWETPYNIDLVIERNNMGSLVFPTLPQDAPSLIHCINRLPQITLTDTNGVMLYGHRTFGFALPDTVTEANFPVAGTMIDGRYDTYELVCQIMTKTESKRVNDGVFIGGADVTPDEVLTDDRDDLLAPDAPSGLKVVRDYYSRIYGLTGYMVFKNGRDFTNDTNHDLVVPAMPNSVEEVYGYCNNLYEGVTIHTSPLVIPPLGSSVREVGQYLFGTFHKANIYNSVTMSEINSPIENFESFMNQSFRSSFIDNAARITINGLPSSTVTVGDYMYATFAFAQSPKAGVPRRDEFLNESERRAYEASISDQFSVTPNDVIYFKSVIDSVISYPGDIDRLAIDTTSHISQGKDISYIPYDIGEEPLTRIPGQSISFGSGWIFDAVYEYEGGQRIYFNKAPVIGSHVIQINQNTLSASASSWCDATYINSQFDPREYTRLLVAAPPSVTSAFIDSLNVSVEKVPYLNSTVESSEVTGEEMETVYMENGWSYERIKTRYVTETSVTAEFSPSPTTPDFFDAVFLDYLPDFDFRGFYPFGYGYLRTIGDYGAFAERTNTERTGGVSNIANAEKGLRESTADTIPNWGVDQFRFDFTYRRDHTYSDKELIDYLLQHPEQWRFSYHLPLT